MQRSVELLEDTIARFFQRSGCFACHAQPAADFAVSVARRKGIRVDEQAASERLQQTTSGLAAAGPAIMERQLVDDGFLYLLEALGRIGHEPDRLTDSLVAAIAAGQDADGAWHSRLGRARTFLEDGDFSRTAMAIRALKNYGTRAARAKPGSGIERAAQWLRDEDPVVTEDLAMQLAGLAAAGATLPERQHIAQPLLKTQLPGGGWAQRSEWLPDAYATA